MEVKITGALFLLPAFSTITLSIGLCVHFIGQGGLLTDLLLMGLFSPDIG